MSTRAIIACKSKEEFADAICLHWDGTLRHCGATLAQFYTDIPKINALINLGNLESIGKDLTAKTGTKALHRDFCVPYVAPFHAHSELQLTDYASDLSVDFIYLWDGTCWKYAKAFGYEPQSQTRWREVPRPDLASMNS